VLATVLFNSLLSSCLLCKNLVIKIHNPIILPLVLYGCETWYFTLREERRLRVFEYRMMERISKPNREEVVGGWRRLHNEELYNLYGSPNIIRVIKSRSMAWTRNVVRTGEMKNAYNILVGNRNGLHHAEYPGIDDS